MSDVKLVLKELGIGLVVAAIHAPNLEMFLWPSGVKVWIDPPGGALPDAIGDSADELERMGFRFFGIQRERRRLQRAPVQAWQYANEEATVYASISPRLGYLFSVFDDGAFVLTGRYPRASEAGPDFSISGQATATWQELLEIHLRKVDAMARQHGEPHAQPTAEARLQAARFYYDHPSQYRRVRRDNALQMIVVGVAALLVVGALAQLAGRV